MSKEFYWKKISEARKIVAQMEREIISLNDAVREINQKRRECESAIANATCDIAEYELLLEDSEFEEMLDTKNHLWTIISVIKGAFESDVKLKAEYESVVETIEEEIKQHEAAKTETLEYYQNKIADLDFVLQWFGY